MLGLGLVPAIAVTPQDLLGVGLRIGCKPQVWDRVELVERGPERSRLDVREGCVDVARAALGFVVGPSVNHLARLGRVRPDRDLEPLHQTIRPSAGLERLAQIVRPDARLDRAVDRQADGRDVQRPSRDAVDVVRGLAGPSREEEAAICLVPIAVEPSSQVANSSTESMRPTGF
jgi:hypothetical protein